MGWCACDYELRRNGRRVALILGTALALVAAHPAAAQVAPTSRDDLGVGRPTTPPPSTGKLSLESEIERGPCPFNDPSFASIRVTFDRVEFSGLPGIPATDLDPAWRSMAGRELPITALCDVRDRASTILSRDGFLAAVQIPPQRIEKGGTVQMDILAAKLVELQVRGDAGPAEKLITDQLEPLRAEPYFNGKEAERRLLLLRDLPGYDARLTLRSAQRQPGEVVGDIQVAHWPVELVVGAQNLGSKATGREGGYAELALNGLLGMGDRTTLSYYNTFDWNEQRIFRFGHELALNANGLRLGGSLLYGESEPSIAGGGFKSETLAGELHLRAAVVRRQAGSLFATGGLEVVDQKLAFAGTTLNKDKLRVAFARLEHVAVDPDSIDGIDGFTPREPRYRSAFTLELRKGLGLLGASEDCSDITRCLPPNIPISNIMADPQAWIIRLEGTAEFRPVPHVTIAISPLLQLTDSPLLPYEQVSLGNYTIGRGLDPGVVQADDALGASFELRAGSLIPRVRGGLSLEPFAFVDFATAIVEDNRVSPDPRDVLTAGGGVRGRWGDHFDFGVVLAAPLKRAGYQVKRSDPRLLITLTAQLLPWGASQ